MLNGIIINLVKNVYLGQVIDVHLDNKLHCMLEIIEQLTLRWGYYNHPLRQVANLFNKVILCVQSHVNMFVQVYTNPFIGERITVPTKSLETE